jgi:hypothetical protein
MIIGIPKGATITTRATGPFDVKLAPQPPDPAAADPTLGRMLIDKQFHGGLEAIGKGQMLTGGTEVKGSAGYVAIERVTGTLHGRTGAFTLQHTGVMTRGVPQLTITVVPDSGSGELVGLSGKMGIQIVEKNIHTISSTPWSRKVGDPHKRERSSKGACGGLSKSSLMPPIKSSPPLVTLSAALDHLPYLSPLQYPGNETP